MIEKYIINYLATAGFDAFAETPPDPPNRYVIVQKISEYESDKIRYTTIAVQSIAETMDESAKLNDEVIDCMHNIVAMSKYGKCKLSNSYPYNDTRQKKYRYQSMFDIVYYNY